MNLRTDDRLAMRITNYAPHDHESVASRENQREGQWDELPRSSRRKSLHPVESISSGCSPYKKTDSDAGRFRR
jgi:hypothetical protein